MQSRAQEASDDAGLEVAVINKTRAVGALDGFLMAWAERRPPELRPSEYSYCDAESPLGVAHLALQYHPTIFLLYLHALMLSMNTVQAEVVRHFPHESCRHRLRNGTVICSNATRSSVGVLSHLRESNAHSVLNSNHGPLLAAYELAVQIVRHPTASAARSDLEL